EIYTLSLHDALPIYHGDSEFLRHRERDVSDRDALETKDDYWLRIAGNYRWERDEWIAYADKLEQFLELVCGQSKDWLMKAHAKQGLHLVRPGAAATAAAPEPSDE